MVNQNKIFSFKIKRQAKNVFSNDVERTVGFVLHSLLSLIRFMTEKNLIFMSLSVRQHENEGLYYTGLQR